MRILHLLNWRLEDVLKVLDKVKEQGFQAIQINPLQPLKEDGFDNWWLSYQPCGFSIGNQYGSKDDLKVLCIEAKKRGIAIYADVICTHVAGSNDGGLTPHERVDEKITSNPYFFREKKLITNWDSRYEVVNYCAGLPSFDMQNWDLQNMIIDFLNELIDCGVEGFRFDSCKSIKTPKEGCDFFPRVFGSLKKATYNYGEVFFASEELIGLYAENLDVLTNTLSRNRNSVVVFAESHDSYYEFSYTKDKSSKEITEEYKNLVHNYPNTIYFARSFDDEWQSQDIKEAHSLANDNNFQKRIIYK